MVRARQSLHLVFSIAVAALSVDGAGCDSNGFTCPCAPCTGFAITLTVVDEAGAPQGGDWTVEASLDGGLVDTSSCDTAVRAGSNTCGFGFDAGVYQIVVRSPTTEKHLVARFAGRAGTDCCQTCLNGESLPVVLPADAP